MGGACPACGESAPSGAKFCEACGQDLNAAPAATCVACGLPEVGPEGYCNSCGHKQPDERDHQVVRDGSVVAGSDRGRRHHSNEDSFAVATLDDGTAVIVVCDGVSSTEGSAQASLVAAEAARFELAAALAAGNGSDESGSDSGSADAGSRVERALLDAAAAAQHQASAAPAGVGEPPSSTLVAVVARPTETGASIAVAWMGDSRAYWLAGPTLVADGGEPAPTPTPSRLLTVDHEIGGRLSRWLGADSPEPVPDIVELDVIGPGTVAVCTDGLWRYVGEPDDFARIVEQLKVADPDRSDPNSVVEGLLALANDGGGHDNITVGLWSIPIGPTTPEATSRELREEESVRE